MRSSRQRNAHQRRAYDSGPCERNRDVLMDDYPSGRALLKHHSPSSIEVSGCALLRDDAHAKGEGGPREGAAPVNPEVIDGGFDTAVGLKKYFLNGLAILLPIVVLQRSDVEVGEVGIGSVIGIDLRNIHRAPGVNNFGD